MVAQRLLGEAPRFVEAAETVERGGVALPCIRLWPGSPVLALRAELALFDVDALALPLVWLLFPFSRRFGLYDHTVFVTYSLCAMSLVVVVVTVLASFNVPALWLALLYPPWHMCRQLKGAYGLTRFGALWRTGVLALGSVLALILFSLVLALLEVAG